MNCQRSSFEIRSIVIEEPERGSSSVLLLLPTVQNRLTLAWRGPYKVVGTVGEVDYKIEINPGKVKTYHINMLKRYFHRENEQKDVPREV